MDTEHGPILYNL